MHDAFINKAIFLANNFHYIFAKHNFIICFLEEHFYTYKN